MTGAIVVNGTYKSQALQNIYNAFITAGQDRGIDISLIDTDEICLKQDAELQNLDLDFFIFWDKDIRQATRLKNAGKRVFNSPSAIALCDNKAFTYLELEKNLVPIPKTIIAPTTFEISKRVSKNFVKSACEKLGYPVIIKECYGSYGEQVYLANNLEQALQITETLGTKEFVFQEFISEFSGKDIRVTVIGGKAVSAILRVNDHGFKSNIAIGGRAERYELSESEKLLAQNATLVLGLDFGGVDILVGKSGLYVCEVNSNPGFLSSDRVNNLNIAGLILDYVRRKIL